MNLAMSKRMKAVLIPLIIISGIAMFLLGQQVLAQEAVVTKIGIAVDPLGSPMSDVDVSLEAEAHRARVDIGAFGRGYDMRHTSGDNLAGAEVHFSNNMTIYSETGDVVFNRTIVFEKGADRTIEVYASLEDLEPGTEMRIVINIEIEIALPTGGSITRNVQKDFTVPVEG